MCLKELKFTLSKNQCLGPIGLNKVTSGQTSWLCMSSTVKIFKSLSLAHCKNTKKLS